MVSIRVKFPPWRVSKANVSSVSPRKPWENCYKKTLESCDSRKNWKLQSQFCFIWMEDKDWSYSNPIVCNKLTIHPQRIEPWISKSTAFWELLEWLQTEDNYQLKTLLSALFLFKVNCLHNFSRNSSLCFQNIVTNFVDNMYSQMKRSP